MAEPTFEEKLATLETIVQQLEQGQVPLEEALTQFKTGIKLSGELTKTLQDAEKTVTEMVKEDGSVVPLDGQADA